MVALMLVPMLGATALAVDVGYWYYKQRDMQSAADSAALAAARTPDEDPAVDPVNDNFINVAKSTAAKYGYLDGQDTVSVSAERVQCPSETDPTKLECTQVTIGYTSPLFFSPIVGFQGNKNGAQGVAAVAVAGDQAGAASHEFCILTLDETMGEAGILAHGVPFADLNGCDIFSNNNLSCTGGNLGAGDAMAVGASSNCGDNQISGADPVADPYENLAENIPEDTCSGTYHQAYKDKGVLKIDNVNNKLTDASSLTGEVKICGDVLLDSSVTLNDVTLVIYNGRLITQNNTLTANNSTVIFSGSNDSTYFHFPSDSLTPSNVGGGTLEIAAPTSDDNPWHGVAIYQDPKLTTNVNIDQAGNSPALNITGLFYAPHAEVEMSGIVNKSGTGYECFVLVAYRVRIDGTGEIFKDGSIDQCDQAGLEVPNSGATVHKWLVQ